MSGFVNSRFDPADIDATLLLLEQELADAIAETNNRKRDKKAIALHGKIRKVAQQNDLLTAEQREKLLVITDRLLTAVFGPQGKKR